MTDMFVMAFWVRWEGAVLDYQRYLFTLNETIKWSDIGLH